MATCQDIITRALRKVNKVGEGQTAPKPYDASVSMDALRSWYLTSINSGLFGRLTEVIVTADYEAGEFERIRKDAALTVTLPDTITDTVTGEDRPPVDLCAVVVVEDGEDPLHSLYDAMLGGWISLEGLSLTDEAPLSTRGPDGLACVLALEVADSLSAGAFVGDLTARNAGRFLATINQRNASARRTVDYEYL